ncbi:Phosphoesterase domain-containing protein [Cephalotus follicularis]|uniref:Phosphoesterase domain-containing protein n=1 Tax=Cephalotus follicularis TaxID=3775 RepID=A0A1Q3D6E9_CEPFO|nr:Phosphoesterase domain-containing protein [Cephalotus follicularis]
MDTEPTTPHPIKTIVVLVQENRSFDHMLGWFKLLNPEINGVTGSESNPVSTSDANSTPIFFNSTSTFIDPDPGHSFDAIYEQLYGQPWNNNTNTFTTSLPSMQGFVQNAERIKSGMGETVMNGFKPEMVPVFKELISEFAVCDRWFASVPTLTQPNRLFVHSATSYGETANDSKMLIEGYPQKTIFDSLDESGFSFGIYYQSVPSTLLYRMEKWRILKRMMNLENKERLEEFSPHYFQLLVH